MLTQFVRAAIFFIRVSDLSKSESGDWHESWSLLSDINAWNLYNSSGLSRHVREVNKLFQEIRLHKDKGTFDFVCTTISHSFLERLLAHVC